MTKPSVLVLGGCGFLGRNFIRYVVENNLVAKVRSADKLRPEMSWMHPTDTQIFQNPIVEYVQANLVNAQSVAKAFDLPGGKFDFVINLASIGPYGQEPEFYETKLIAEIRICGEEAKRRNIRRWIEVSTAQVYKASSKNKDETGPLAPWTSVATAKLNVENTLISLAIPHVIVRPVICYGPGDVTGLMPRLICGAVYKRLNEEMKFLWAGDLQINTVHVRDVAHALWFLTDHGNNGEIFNLADTAKSTQESINKIIQQIFHIRTGFVGTIMSNLARVNFKGIVADTNEKHMEPWGQITAQAGIDRTPLSPYLEPDLLLNNDLAINGQKITKLGFQYQYPAPTLDLIRESLQYWIDIRAFPPLA